ncbi:MAG TPA: ribosome biogenesis GTPase Der [Bacillota bacterium]|nr:ribosome biogenesis GTPase Der [Bacillota bacterium]HPZ21517.1 ribosome biogenesis GTPase Der [Bacillota bacterium]HQD19616.1 ribosome biogenesis GTPase Der [Bacillota bacterium]
MMLPIVSVVGRPNVGKSTLFNKILQRRLAIVEDTPGVTRDRLYGQTDWGGHNFMLVDTGGFAWDDDDPLAQAVTAQAQEAVWESDVILFMVDARQGLTPDDKEVADLLRRSKKPVILVVNKVDDFSRSQEQLVEFFELGLGDPLPISAANGLNIGDLLDAVVAHIEKLPVREEDAEAIAVAVIGRPNVGKSSLVNRLAGKERAVVSDIPGTTRDAIDTTVYHNGRPIVLIDTAGLRRKSRLASGIEYYSMLRTVRAVQRSDIALLVLDGKEGLTEQDKRIAGIAHEAGKAIIILVNKWDIVKKDSNTMARYIKDLRAELKFIEYANIEFVSALTGARLSGLLSLVEKTMEQYQRRISTGLLNDLLTDAIMANPPSAKGTKVKIFYITQVAVKPPRFVIFTSNPELVHFSWLRYLENRIREAFGFQGTPLVFKLRKRGSK